MKKILTLFVSALMIATCLSIGTSKKAYAANVNYLTFTAEEANSTISLSWASGSGVNYSIDGGSSWSGYDEGTTITLTNIGDKVSFKGSNVKTSPDSSDTHFIMTGKIAASGDLTSLTNEVGGNVELGENAYAGMFFECDALTTAPNLPSTTIGTSCYEKMFFECTNLTAAPALPATTLGAYCYYKMFSNCTNLTTVPTELPAETLKAYCYSSMFENCEKLTVAPALKGKTLAEGCYNAMFFGCSSLIAAPELPVTELAESCYSSMFQDCTSLTSVPKLPATTLKNNCYSLMFDGCSKLAVKETSDASIATWDFTNVNTSNCVSGMVSDTCSQPGCVNEVESGKKYIVSAYSTIELNGNGGTVSSTGLYTNNVKVTTSGSKTLTGQTLQPSASNRYVHNIENRTYESASFKYANSTSGWAVYENGVNYGGYLTSSQMASLFDGFDATKAYTVNDTITIKSAIIDGEIVLTGYPIEATASQAGYTFDGWYTAKDGGTKVTVPTTSQTLYAHWTANSGGGSTTKRSVVNTSVK